MKFEYDIVIVGGGMVGASLACSLAPLTLNIAIIEQYPFNAETQPSFDDRSTALAYGTRRIFEKIGLWPLIADKVSPIHNIHISDRGHFGATRLDSRESGVDALGYVIENHVLGNGLQTLLNKMPNVDIICPAQVMQIDVKDDVAEIEIRQGEQVHQLKALLVVAADGSQSVIRQQLAVPVKTWDYGQTALISNVGISQPHRQIAYERFTDTGPLALLPMQDTLEQDQIQARCSLVWTLRNDQVEHYLQMGDAEFLAQLQQRFGRRLGEFVRVGKRQSYPLRMIRVPEQVQARVALIGNAAHTLHPVAGQGYNLGIRDVAVLSAVLADALKRDIDIGDISLLRDYAQWRKQDHRRVMAFTDGLVRIFSNPLFPVKWFRSAALTALDCLPSLKKMLGRQSMGLAGKMPRLPGN